MTIGCQTCDDHHEVTEDGPPLGPSGFGWDGKPYAVECPECCVPCSHCGVHEWHGLEDGVRWLRDGDGGYWCSVGCLTAWLLVRSNSVRVEDVQLVLRVCDEFVGGKTDECCEVYREEMATQFGELIKDMLEEITKT